MTTIYRAAIDEHIRLEVERLEAILQIPGILIADTGMFTAFSSQQLGSLSQNTEDMAYKAINPLVGYYGQEGKLTFPEEVREELTDYEAKLVKRLDGAKRVEDPVKRLELVRGVERIIDHVQTLRVYASCFRTEDYLAKDTLGEASKIREAMKQFGKRSGLIKIFDDRQGIREKHKYNDCYIFAKAHAVALLNPGETVTIETRDARFEDWKIKIGKPGVLKELAERYEYRYDSSVTERVNIFHDPSLDSVKRERLTNLRKAHYELVGTS